MFSVITAKEAQEISDRVRKEVILPLKSLFEHIEKRSNAGYKSLVVDNCRSRDELEVYFDMNKEQKDFLEKLGYWFDNGENHDNPEIHHYDYDTQFICWP